ncbi:MAG: M28 family peptidase [Planctomycetota bacterium]
MQTLSRRAPRAGVALIFAYGAVTFAAAQEPERSASTEPSESAADPLDAIGGDVEVTAGISSAELRGHVQALSHDLLRGRPLGSEESMVAAAYCAARLEAAGLRPGAADGTWLQRIPCQRTVYDEVPELALTLNGGDAETLAYGAGFTFRGRASDVDGLACVYVEEENEVPETARADVALVFLTSAGRARRWLKSAGHPGGAGFGLVVVPNTRAKVGAPARPRPGSMLPAGGAATLPAQIAVRGEAASLFEDHAVESIALETHGRVERRDDANVVGVLPGTRAGTPDESYLLLCAHRDHVGVKPLQEGQPAPEDAILNGADDDASGCSVVLELAEAIAAGERPERSLVVVLVTGEERGMVGSRHFAEDPTVPLESIACALNFEMLGRPDDLVGGAGKLWLTGDDRSSLGPALRGKGVEVSADPRPEGNFFVRSDNVSFARVGVVSQTLSSYNMHADYHKVTDEWDTLDYAHMERASAACLDAVRSLLAGDWAPTWNEGEPKL